MYDVNVIFYGGNTMLSGLRYMLNKDFLMKLSQLY